MTPLDPKNANFSTIEFRAEPPMFFIYILVVYEEYIIKSSNFNIRKISLVRVPLWFFRGHFLHPQKLPLGATARSHFLWDPRGLAPSVLALYQRAKLYLKGTSPGPCPVVEQQNWEERHPGCGCPPHVQLIAT